jgi:hypothetical protein
MNSHKYSKISLHTDVELTSYHYYYYYYYLSPLYRVFKVMYLKQIMLLGYIVLQLFCCDKTWYM